MIWVEIRHLAYYVICGFACVAAIVMLIFTHASVMETAAAVVALLLFMAAVAIAFGRFDRGRRPRYGPVLVDWLGITSGVTFGIWQVYALGRGLHSARDATALVTGLALALVAIAALAAQRRRRSARSG